MNRRIIRILLTTTILLTTVLVLGTFIPSKDTDVFAAPQQSGMPAWQRDGQLTPYVIGDVTGFIPGFSTLTILNPTRESLDAIVLKYSSFGSYLGCALATTLSPNGAEGVQINSDGSGAIQVIKIVSLRHGTHDPQNGIVVYERMYEGLYNPREHENEPLLHGAVTETLWQNVPLNEPELQTILFDGTDCLDLL